MLINSVFFNTRMYLMYYALCSLAYGKIVSQAHSYLYFDWDNINIKGALLMRVTCFWNYLRGNGCTKGVTITSFSSEAKQLVTTSTTFREGATLKPCVLMIH